MHDRGTRVCDVPRQATKAKESTGEPESKRKKFINIFTADMPAHEKILSFTKKYCLPELIDSKELISMAVQKEDPTQE